MFSLEAISPIRYCDMLRLQPFAAYQHFHFGGIVGKEHRGLSGRVPPPTNEDFLFRLRYWPRARSSVEHAAPQQTIGALLLRAGATPPPSPAAPPRRNLVAPIELQQMAAIRRLNFSMQRVMAISAPKRIACCTLAPSDPPEILPETQDSFRCARMCPPAHLPRSAPPSVLSAPRRRHTPPRPCRRARSRDHQIISVTVWLGLQLQGVCQLHVS